MAPGLYHVYKEQSEACYSVFIDLTSCTRKEKRSQWLILKRELPLPWGKGVSYPPMRHTGAWSCSISNADTMISASPYL